MQIFFVPLEPGVGVWVIYGINTDQDFREKIPLQNIVTLSCPCYQVLAILSSLSCPGWHVRPTFLYDLSQLQLSRPGCLSRTVLSWLSCHCCPSRLPCPSYRFPADLTQLCPRCPVLSVTFWSSCPTVCDLSCAFCLPCCPVLAV